MGCVVVRPVGGLGGAGGEEEGKAVVGSEVARKVGVAVVERAAAMVAVAMVLSQHARHMWASPPVKLKGHPRSVPLPNGTQSH